jgi:Holliday junction resolvase-like predicted endonuclease
MNADIVHSVAKALPPEELQRLYFLIQEQIGEIKVIVKKSKKTIITKDESMENVLKSLNKTKKTRFRKLA